MKHKCGCKDPQKKPLNFGRYHNSTVTSIIPLNDLFIFDREIALYSKQFVCWLAIKVANKSIICVYRQ